jgi:hypothetical protein
MKRPTRQTLPLTWTVRLRGRGIARPSSPRPDIPPAAARPGIAARWKPRDRVSAAGN